jgi:Spy/CpxP family protein refolding chaperone
MKNMLLKTLLACALASLAFAHAQQPPDPAQLVQKRVTLLAGILSLSPSQQQQATTLFTAAQNTMQPLRQQLKAARASLQAAVQSNSTPAITQQAGAIGSLVTQMITARANAEAAFIQTLTPDQQNKYSLLRSMRSARRHRQAG